jgi:hypothetical protein
MESGSFQFERKKFDEKNFLKKIQIIYILIRCVFIKQGNVVLSQWPAPATLNECEEVSAELTMSSGFESRLRWKGNFVPPPETFVKLSSFF